MKLYLDDIRWPSDTYPLSAYKEWRLFRTPDEFLYFLEENWEDVDAISLDNDLGLGVKEGRQVLAEIEEWCEGIHPHFQIGIHSANPVAVQEMTLTIQRMKERRDAQD